MSNPFDRTLHVGAPGRNYLAITPNDGDDLTDIATSLYIETGVDVTFISISGATCTVNVSDFGWIFCGVMKVLSTGTTASGIHAITH